MNFWQGKRVLITGHTGFKGSWLSLWLQLWRAQVAGLALAPPEGPSLFKLAHIEETMQSYLIDVKEFEKVLATFQNFQPQILIHMAAQPLVRLSYHKPTETYATNVMGTVHVLEAARQINTLKAILIITTDKCYENKEWSWGYREEDRLGGFDPYSNSKACAELVTSAYRNSYFKNLRIGVASARAGNVFGGGDWAEDRLIPDLFKAWMQKKVGLLRNPGAIRPWQHVLEPLSAYLLLVEKLYQYPDDFSEAWNFGPDENDAKPVHWMADFMAAHWGEGAHWQREKKDFLHETSYLRLDSSKAKQRLGWKPHWDLKKGLSETIAWYKAYQAFADMRKKTINQILDYQNECLRMSDNSKEINNVYT